MTDDVMWQEDRNVALYQENLFISQQAIPSTTAIASDLEPSRVETERAVANIRAWRMYLPAACLATMIDEGWQWST